jgi:hypothetical protein
VSATPETPEPTVVPPPEENAGPAMSAAPSVERPEVAAGAAFAGGFVLALILKRLAR